ncbi:MAG: translation initiation factor IF-2 N-terminal domain-containing protein, partial [Dissulfurimicrobium sp.]
MAKIRVHELAKELGIANKEMELRLKELGYRIKSYMSTLEDYEAQEIRRKILAEKEGVAAFQKKESTPVVRRRHAVIRIKKLVPSGLSEESTKTEEGPAQVQAQEVSVSEEMHGEVESGSALVEAASGAAKAGG